MSILSIEEIAHDLQSEASLLRLAGCHPRRVVLAHGCFDVLSLGHLRHLESARKMGDLLVVSVTPDHFVNKGAGRPVFGEQERAEMVDALRCVSYTCINRWPTAVELIQILKPAIYVKGGEYRDRMSLALQEELAALKEVGGALRFSSGVEKHTTEVLKRLDRALLASM